MINTYKIGDKIATGVNLESAALSLGYTGIEIIPLWRGKSNGKYKLCCNEHIILLCEWVEKVNKLRKS